jgi:hypothetical protein
MCSQQTNGARQEGYQDSLEIVYMGRRNLEDDGGVADGKWLMVTTQRIGIQLPRARWTMLSKTERSRARSGQLQCRVGRRYRADTSILRLPVYHLPGQ